MMWPFSRKKKTTSEFPTMANEIKENGGFRSLFKEEFGIALIFAVILSAILYLAYPDVSIISMSSNVMITFIGVSGALLGFIIAAYALILSSGDKKFNDIFIKSPFYKELRVDFSWTSLIIGLCIMISIFGALLSEYASYWVVCVFLVAAAFTFIWGVMNVIMIMANSLRGLGLILSSR